MTTTIIASLALWLAVSLAALLFFVIRTNANQSHELVQLRSDLDALKLKVTALTQRSVVIRTTALEIGRHAPLEQVPFDRCPHGGEWGDCPLCDPELVSFERCPHN